MDIEPLVANCRDYWLGWGSAERVDGQLAYSSKHMAWPASMSSQPPRTNGAKVSARHSRWRHSKRDGNAD